MFVIAYTWSHSVEAYNLVDPSGISIVGFLNRSLQNTKKDIYNLEVRTYFPPETSPKHF